MRVRRASYVLSSMGAALLAFACLSPTQVTLRIVTDLDCVQIARNQIALYSGDPKAEAPVTSTNQCAPRAGLADIGTLVIVPSDGNDNVVDLSVVVGVRGPSADCAADNYTNCIRARRRVRFVPHEPLELPIEISRACVGQPCDPTSTCFRGRCVSIDVMPNGAGCAGPECDAPSPSPSDASVLDDAPSGPSGPPVVTLHVPRTVMPRGITIVGNDLYWTEPFPGDPSATAIVHADKSQSGQTGVALPKMGWDSYGICAIGSELYCAVSTSQTACAFGTDVTGKPGTAISCSGGSFFGVACIAGKLYVVGKQGALLADPSSPTRLTPGFYAEADDDRMVYATSFGLARWDLTWSFAGDPAETVLDMRKPMRGVAVTPTHWLVSSAGGEIYVASKSQTSVPRAPIFSGFTKLEDIAWDDTTKTLYAAATRDGQAGIYAVTNLAASF